MSIDVEFIIIIINKLFRRVFVNWFMNNKDDFFCIVFISDKSCVFDEM